MDEHDLDPIHALCAKDSRYEREAYAFTIEALNYTVKQRRREGHEGHITGPELLEGIRDYAEKSFGYLTKVVFAQWGVTRTEDFGEIVYGLIDVGLLRKQESDSKEHFANGYDFDEVFEKSLT